jgi:hypothetical protein
MEALEMMEYSLANVALAHTFRAVNCNTGSINPQCFNIWIIRSNEQSSSTIKGSIYFVAAALALKRLLLHPRTALPPVQYDVW